MLFRSILTQGSLRVQPWTAYSQLLCIHTLAKIAPVTPLSSTLTRPSRKNIKTRDFNSFRIRSYSTPLRNKLIRNNLTKHGGRGEGVLCTPNLLGLLYLLRSRIHHSPFAMSPALRGVMVDFARYETVKPDYRGNARVGFFDRGGPRRAGLHSQRVLDFLRQVIWLQTCQ